MPAPTVLPEYVYKIMDSEPPSPIPEVLPLSELDKHDGFIHLSTAAQVPNTAGLFFTSYTTLWLLKIPLSQISSSTQWDDPPNTGFPHLYDSSLGAANVASVERFDRAEDKVWKEVFAASQWLV